MAWILRKAPIASTAPIQIQKEEQHTIKVTKMYQQIQGLSERSLREKEILAVSPKYGIAKQFAAEFRQIESERLAKRQALLKEAWDKLQALGYKKFQYGGNAAYQSGHSDYLEKSENWVKWGVVAPDGTKFEGQASWTEAIIPAIAHAGLTSC